MHDLSFQVLNWFCHRNSPCQRGPLVSLPYIINVPVNNGTRCLPYRFEMHNLGEGFFATDFAPFAWSYRSDRFSRLVCHEGFRVDFRHLVRVCFGIFRQDILPSTPDAVFVVCGSRTTGESSATLEGCPTRKYRLYRAIFVRLCAQCGCRLVDDARRSLFLVCPSARAGTEVELLSAYWRIRSFIDPILGGNFP